MAALATVRTSCLRSSPIRRSWRIASGSVRFRPISSLADLESEMQQRQIVPIFDDLTPQASFRLDMTLADYLPDSSPPLAPLPTTPPQPLPIPHHMIYFEPTKRSSEMLADGTNPDQSPGEPFVRRMWAGGQVLYNHSDTLTLDGGRGVCAEFIRSVVPRGKQGDEKLYVAVERRLAKASTDEIDRLSSGNAQTDLQAKADLDHRVRQRLWRNDPTDFGPSSIVETRNIVFMRSRSKEEAAKAAQTLQDKIVKPVHKPDFSHQFMPDAKLLFRFSALTFNAHAIHLDPQYSRDVEGHRDLLFHGPLSFTCMVVLLQQHLKKHGKEVIKSIEYRNMAPLYCNETVTFCGTKTGQNKYEIWAQTPQGGLAVKGTAVTA